MKHHRKVPHWYLNFVPPETTFIVGLFYQYLLSLLWQVRLSLFVFVLSILRAMF